MSEKIRAIIAGVGSILVLVPNEELPTLSRPDGEMSDRERIERDWRKIGSDMNTAIGHVRRELDSNVETSQS